MTTTTWTMISPIPVESIISVTHHLPGTITLAIRTTTAMVIGAFMIHGTTVMDTAVMEVTATTNPE